jgi:hypothetical protein
MNEEEGSEDDANEEDVSEARNCSDRISDSIDGSSKVQSLSSKANMF